MPGAWENELSFQSFSMAIDHHAGTDRQDRDEQREACGRVAWLAVSRSTEVEQ
jgi:cation transport regulator ChaB